MAEELCIPNIGPRERHRRLIVGVAMFAVAAVVAAMLLAFGAPRAWRLFILFPAWMGAIGVFQVKEKT